MYNGQLKNEHLVPPNDLDAERSVIGALLVSESAASIVSEKLTREDFYSETHRVLFDAAMTLYAKSEPIDQLTMKAELEGLEEYERTGGREYLFRLIESVPTAANVKNYAERVHSQAVLRRLIDACEITKQECLSPFSDDPAEALDKAEQRIYGLSYNRAKDGALRPTSELVSEVMEDMQRHYEAGGMITGTPTGFGDLDEKTSGCNEGDLIILAARPAMGKTSLALNIAWNVAAKSKLPVAIFSLEMDRRQLIQRFVSQLTRVPLNRIRQGNIKADEWPGVVRAYAEIGRAPIHIDDTSGITVPSIRSRLRRMSGRIKDRFSLVVIDYIGLITPHDKSGNRVQEVSAISRALKVLAREFGVPVLALSQLSRACEARDNKRPFLSDLRDSGQIEADADVVTFLYRDEVYKQDTEDKGQAELNVAKNRNGPIGMVPLVWLESCTSFGSLNRVVGRDD